MNNAFSVKYRDGSQKAQAHESSVVERVKLVRMAEGLTQKEIANRLHISWRTYQNYEVGTRTISADFIKRMIVAFELDSDWLLFGEEGPSCFCIQCEEDTSNEGAEGKTE